MSAKLYYQSYKLDDDAPWLVLIHGLFGNLDNLSGIRRGLESSHNILSVDLPDHGRSEWTSGFSFKQCADSLIALLDSLQIPSATLLGHSLGGKVAMSAALQHPDRVDRLILADIAPVAYPPRHANVFAGLNNVELAQLKDRATAQRQMAEHIREAGVIQFLLKSLYQADTGEWAWRFNLSMLERDYAALSGAITSDELFDKPVLFIKGGNSDYLTSEHQAHIRSLFPNSEAKIIQGTGHWLHAEKPQVFNSIVSRFLDNH